MTRTSGLLCCLVVAGVIGSTTKSVRADHEPGPGVNSSNDTLRPGENGGAFGGIGPGCVDGFCPHERGTPPARYREASPYGGPALDGLARTASAVHSFDLGTLTIRLEFATEVLVEEIEFEVGHDPRGEAVLVAVHDLMSAATHLRESALRDGDATHLAGDFEHVRSGMRRLNQLFDLRWTRVLARASDRVMHSLRDVGAYVTAPPVEAPVNGPFLEQPIRSGPSASGQSPAIPADMKGIADLPLTEQRLAMEQRVCPVTQDLLGSMGKPIKVEVGGRTVFVCCLGCVDTVRSDPQRYLSKSPPTPVIGGTAR